MNTNFANWITASRIFLSLPICLLLLRGDIQSRSLAGILFLVASLTDYLDGKVARTQKITSDFGKAFDPFADKILILAVFLSFVFLKEIQFWMFLLILIREVGVTVMRSGAIKKFTPTLLAKSKTAVQMCGILLIIFLPFAGFARKEQFTSLIMYVILIITLVSGIQYIFISKRKA